jgi:hypothetical protein
MRDFPDKAVPWVSTTAAASTDEDVLEIGAPAADAIPGLAGSRRSAPAFGPVLLSYCPHAVVLTACVFGVAWLMGSHFIGPARTVVQQVSLQSAETGYPAQSTAEELEAQKARLEAMRAVESPKNVASLGNTKARPDAAKSEISAGIAEVSNKVVHSRPKSAEMGPRVSKPLDRVGLEIAAILATAPVADRSPASVARRRAHGGRGDAFDPSRNPTAPGAPRQLGTIARAGTANNSSAEYPFGQRTN